MQDQDSSLKKALSSSLLLLLTIVIGRVRRFSVNDRTQKFLNDLPESHCFQNLLLSEPLKSKKKVICLNIFVSQNFCSLGAQIETYTRWYYVLKSFENQIKSATKFSTNLVDHINVNKVVACQNLSRRNFSFKFSRISLARF